MKINGSLVFDASGLSQIENLRVEKLAALPTHTSADIGRLVYVTGSQVIWLGGASAWIALATGGNAAALQTEVDAVEVSLGVAVNSDGTFNAAGFSGIPGGAPTSFTDAINKLAVYATGKDTLAELDDVTITSAAAGDFLMHNGTDWVDHVLVAADLTDVTATAAELNILDGATLTVTELNYVDGVTSPIQTQLDAKQDEDAGLNSLAALADVGIVVQTAENVFAARELVAPAAGVTITNGDGAAGNPTFALANDLAALEGLTGTGYVVRTGDGTATNRAITGTAGNIVVTNGDGVASDTSLNLAAITQANSGTFSKVTLDGFGRVVGNTPVVLADITALADGTYVNAAGDTMTGNLIMSGGATVTGLPTPSGAGDAASKAYVDSLLTGLTWEAPVDAIVADATARDALTGLSVGDRVFMESDNSVYTVTVADPLTFGPADPLEDGAAFFNRDNDTGWTFNGTDAVQFTGSGTLNAGIGLVQDGNTLNVNLGAGISQLPSDEVGIDLANAVAGALILTTDGTNRSTATGAQLHLLTGGASGLAQSAAGLYIAPSGVTNAMLANNHVGLNADVGEENLTLGDTLEIVGDSVQGITTSVVGQTVTITATDAGIAQKGVASFATGDFDVTAGAVSIKAGGVDNAQLAFSTITLTGTTGSDAVALGESVSVLGDGAAITTAVTANSVAVSARLASTTATGVASFLPADFAVSGGGEVSLVAKGLDDLDDVAVSGAAAGEMLVFNGTNFVNRKTYHLYTGASAATHTVTHGIGQQYCNVTVVDASDNVVIPQSIVFDSATELTVTFNTAIACKVIVMGVNAAA